MFQKAFPFVAIALLLICPVLLSGFLNFNAIDQSQFAKQIVVSLGFFLIPVVFFYRNLKLYLYALLPLVIVTPIFIFCLYFFAVNPGFELVALILQTNIRETKEAAAPLMVYFIPFFITYIFLYSYSVRCVAIPKSAFLPALSISLFGALMVGGTIYVEKQLYYKNISQLNKDHFLNTYHYPFSLVSGVRQARMILNKNNLSKAENFRFKATKIDTVNERQVFVLIIGETSRYDRWQVNGYSRVTSPKLALRKDLLTFSDVVAGAHYTWVSVPQFITRATPDNYDLQYREKSVMSAFSEAGFKTVWLSNQSADEVFWTGSIVLHARTADVSVFSPTYSPNFEFADFYDERLLPLLDSMLRTDDKNLFVVLHTMGNHWEYTRRYPVEFDHFTPSGYTQTISPPSREAKEAILNSYDNSIRYADHIIDSVISIVESHAGLSAVMFVSDHGEDLFDTDPEHIDFHFRPSAATLKVPLFIWTSEGYNSTYPTKRLQLEQNLAKKIGAENIFYTLVDLGNLTFPEFDSTKSISSPYFQPSLQKFYNDENRAVLYSDIVQPVYATQ